MDRMLADHAYVERNTHERERLRGLVARLTDDDLRRRVTDRWTVADMLGHIAFWDARALSLAEKLEAAVPFVPADHEPEDVDPINAAARALVPAPGGGPRGRAAEGPRPPGPPPRPPAAVARGPRQSP